MDPIAAFLQGAVLPGTVIFLLVLALGWRGLDVRVPLAGGAVAAAAGYWAGYLAVFGVPGFPSVRSVEWMPPAAAVCVLLAVPFLTRHGGALWTAAAWVPLLGALAWVWHMVARGVVRREEFIWPGVGVLAFGALVVAVFLALPAMRTFAREGEEEAGARRWPVVPFLLMVLATAASIGLLASGSARVSQMLGIVAAGSGAVCAAGLLTRNNPALPGAEGVLAMLAGFHLLLATWYSELGAPAVVAFMAAGVGIAGFALGERLETPAGRWLRIGGGAGAIALSIATTGLIIIVRGLPDL